MIRLGIAVSCFYESVAEGLLENCLQVLKDNPVIHYDVHKVPGAYELPLLAKRLCKTARYNAIICLGAVIRGETSHFDFVSQQTAFGIMKTSLDYDLPIIFGVLTTDNISQAKQRLTKGSDAALSALQMIDTLKKIH